MALPSGWENRDWRSLGREGLPPLSLAVAASAASKDVGVGECQIDLKAWASPFVIARSVKTKQPSA